MAAGLLVACAPAPEGASWTRASDAEIRVDVERMARDFLEHRPMRGFVHDMPLTSAYYWQGEFARYMEPEMGTVVGYKTGGHDPGPGFAIFPPGGIRGTILEGMMRASGSAVSLDETRRGFLEADLAVRVGDDSINDAVTDLEILAGLDAIIPFAEIPDPYYEEYGRTINGTIVANMGSRFSFAGEPVPIEANEEWLRRLATFTFAVHDEHGNEIERGSISGWFEPIRVVRWIRDDLRESGIRLVPGQLLSLGNIGIIRQLHEGSPRGPAYTSDEFTLSYYGFGELPASVTIRIERGRPGT
jgi:2-keto-4-pentenoate hydratase